MTTSPTHESAESRAGYFDQSQIEARKKERQETVEKAAPLVNAAVQAAVTEALSAADNPAIRGAAPLAGLVAGEGSESASRIACEALIIPGAAKIEKGSGILQRKIDERC